MTDANNSNRSGRIGLVMSGGGARAAYQVGVLQGIARMLPHDVPNPFPIICGTSAGALNAAGLAANATNFNSAVAHLVRVWGTLRVNNVYRSDFVGVIKNSAHWLAALFATGFTRSQHVSLLDNAPLKALLERTADFSKIQVAIDAGHLDAVSITASGYGSGQSISFYQGRESFAPWTRARRSGCRAEIGLAHLLASSAIPFVFPPVPINGEYFGDGSIQQLAPVSPALHLGADRVLVIGVGKPPNQSYQPAGQPTYPSLAQIAGYILDSIFLDGLEMDLERLQRINQTIRLVPPETIQHKGLALRPVEALVIAPSQRLEPIAAQYAHHLPPTIRFFMRGIGAMKRGGANVLSYLLFDRAYCRALMRLGYQDATAKTDEILKFIGHLPMQSAESDADQPKHAMAP